MRRIWVSKVKRKHWSPTLTTVLCSDHFENGAYDTDPELLKSLGFRKKPRLRKEAIPTLFSHVGVDDSQSKRRSASEKRQRQQVVNEMVLAAEQKHKSSDSGEPQTEVSHPSTADLGEETSLLTASALCATPGASALPSAEHEACSHLSFGVQANVSMADKSLQTQSSFFPGIKKYSRGTQVSPSQHCIGTQCNLLIQSVTRGTQYEPQEEFVQLVDSDDEMETDPDYDFIDVSDDAEMDTDDDMEFEEVLLLAVIHFNENSNRAQAITEGGQSQWRVSYPKARQGDPVVKPVKVPITFDYVHQFIAEVLDLRQKYPSYRLADVLAEERNLPPPIASQYEKPAKDLLVGAHRCRFNLTK